MAGWAQGIYTFTGADTRDLTTLTFSLTSRQGFLINSMFWSKSLIVASEQVVGPVAGLKVRDITQTQQKSCVIAIRISIVIPLITVLFTVTVRKQV